MKRFWYMMLGGVGLSLATVGYDLAEGEWYRFTLMLPFLSWVGWTYDRSEPKK